MKQVIDNKKKKATLPKGIRQLASGKFIADVCINGKRTTKTVNTLEEAIIARQKMLSADGKRNTPAASSLIEKETIDESWTLQQAYERTLSLCWRGRAWADGAQRHYKDLSDFFGESTPLHEITLDRIDEYVDAVLARKLSNSTVNRKLAVLSRILRTAVERGKLAAMPKIPRRKEAKHRIRFLSAEEENRFITTFMQFGYHHHAEAFLLLLYTGFRTGECWRLECRDIDLLHGTITAWKTKNGNPRTIPIVERIRPILERRMREEADASGRLFPQGTNIWFEKAWNKVKKVLNLQADTQLVPHTLRHTCASRLAQRGISMMVIKEWMGHNNINTTMRYTHLAPKDLLYAAKILSSQQDT